MMTSITEIKTITITAIMTVTFMVSTTVIRTRQDSTARIVTTTVSSLGMNGVATITHFPTTTGMGTAFFPARRFVQIAVNQISAITRTEITKVALRV